MRDEIAAARRIRYATDPEFRRKASAQAKARYARNRAPFIAKAIQWCRTNPERKRATSENRRAVKAMATGTITPEAWQAVLHQFSNACAHCLKTGEPMTMDHVLALSRGGSHEIDNVVPLCKSCNSSKREWGVLSLLSSDFRLRP
jgi:5-methylcytosine-specific restriction endonuclease McrA